MTTRGLRLAVAAVVAVPLLGYPALVLAGGGAGFPSRDECVRVAGPESEGDLDLVYGRFDTPAAAEELRDRVVAVGFVGTEVEPDGCGRWKVVYDGIESYEQGAGVIAEARRQGFSPVVELAPG